MTDLKPCPFCGAPAERIDFGASDADGVLDAANAGGSCIACTQCQASGPVEFGRKESFISNWNRRVERAGGGVDEALRAAAASLRTIASHAGRMECLESLDEVRGYANSRATVAEAALRADGEG